ncbi:hypothetical protein FisN_3Hu524 [Fistulifera solaris]|uniref:PiggyBac transposable element-derived protein domain-containing protein n=1 Tax=Fistulifera solaris TaxID=1519565 RepID=A0A1Z5K2Z1_FISSO|nr:hypothetical protein FisN_3Hu524 [Fistulifera solaris]|eukprot:GAX20624.1 hypothetical protein FisN_3Hu524 [Fistulifera solaris]
MTTQTDWLAQKILQECQARTEGWNEDLSDNKPWKLLTEKEFAEQFLTTSLHDSFRQAAQSIPEEVFRVGNDYSQSTDAFRVLFSDDAIQKLVDCTNGYLRHNGIFPETNIQEYREFLAHKFLLSRYRCEAIFRDMLPMLANQHGFHAMNWQRFQNLYKCTHGYPIEEHSNHDNDVWQQRKPVLRKLNELERLLFEPSMKFMLNKKSGILAVDEERLNWRRREEYDYEDREPPANGPACDRIVDALTGVVFGMRLRVRGESPRENVEELLQTLPPIAAPDQVRVCFDEEYGNMRFLTKNVWERNLDVINRARQYYSNHPFITEEEIASKRNEWKEANITDQVQQEAYDKFEPFILDDRSNLRIVTKTLPSDETKRIRATALRDSFDPLSTCKLHRIFSSGGDEMSGVWVAKTEATTVPYKTLFKNRSCPLPIETQLLETCHPITLMQEAADWLCQRAFRLSGSLTGLFLESETSEQPGVDLRVVRMRQCLDSWFGSQRPTIAMPEEDEYEEEPIINEIMRFPWITEVYEIGLVEWKRAPFIAVSPDGVAEFCHNDASHHACILIKKRTDWSDIEDAEEVASIHGSVVHCKFGDDVFKDCVPLGDRHELLQHAIVTGLDYGIFVTSKQEIGDETKIVQVVVVAIQASDKYEASLSILSLGKDLLGWLFEPAIMARCYLVESSFPEWLPSASQEANIIRNHYKLWVAQYKQIRNDGVKYNPTLPLESYEYSEQHLYNLARKSLKKHRADRKDLSIDLDVSDETRYVFEMIDAVFYNHWRFAQGIDKVLPFLEANVTKTIYEKISERMLQLELSSHVYKMPLDFLAKSAIDKRIGKEVGSRMRQQLVVSEKETDTDVMKDVEKLKRKRKFPVGKNRPQIFHREPALKRLRLATTPTHMPVNKGKEHYGNLCALCGVCRTSVWCEICCVPLCSGRHFTLWHSADDLLETHVTEKAESLKAKVKAPPAAAASNTQDDEEDASDAQSDESNK